MEVQKTDLYFDWLYRKIGSSTSRKYRKLAAELHSIKFIPSYGVDMDRNRAIDGLNLRVDFMTEYGPYGSSTNRGACTMLEFLVGITKRMAFLMGSDDHPAFMGRYFLKLIKNLGLDKLEDDVYDILNGDFHTEDACYRFMNRLYDSDGKGGLFPLKHTHDDQRYVEIWYQMQAWMMENAILEMG